MSNCMSHLLEKFHPEQTLTPHRVNKLELVQSFSLSSTVLTVKSTR